MKPYTWRQSILDSGLRPTTRHVLLTLSCYINDAGQSAYPSTITLAQKTGLSERAVITNLHEAAKAGWLKIRKHGFGGQKWARNEYYPTTPTGDFDTEGAEPASVPKKEKKKKALNLLPEGTEPNDKKALNEVPTNRPVEPTSELSNKAPRKKRAASSDDGVIFDDWMAGLKASGQKPIPEGHAVFTYADEIGLPIEYVRLCWLKFKQKFSGAKKKYVDWAAAFHVYVRENYLKVWFHDAANDCWKLTTAGIQLQKEMRGQA